MSVDEDSAAALLRRLAKPPITTWLLKYDWRTFLADFGAALIVASLLVPQALAYSTLAGLPAVFGLHANVVGPMLYSIYGTLSHGIMGVAALTCIVSRLAVVSFEPDSLTATDRSRYEDLIFGVALLSGVIQLVLGLCRGGVVADLLSRPVLSAFLSAAGAIMVISQVRPLFGLPDSSSGDDSANSLVQLFNALADLGSIHWPTVGLSAATLLLLLASRWKRIPKWVPSWLLIMGTSILISWAADFESHGIRVVGAVEGGFPSPRFPALSAKDVWAILPGAFEVACVGFVGQYALGVQFGQIYRYEVDGNLELVASGLSNIVGSLFASQPVTICFSRTAACADSGGRTPMVNFLVCLVTILTLLVLTPLFRPLPLSVLACVILVSIRQLISPSDVKFLWRVSKVELLVYMTTFFATVGLGIELGILLGFVSSLIALLFRSAMATTVRLGRIPGTWFSVEGMVSVEQVDSVMVVGFTGPLFFGNSSALKTFLETATATMMTAAPSDRPAGEVALIDFGDDDVPPRKSALRESAHRHLVADRAVLLDFENVSSIDATALQTLQIVLPRCFNLSDAPSDRRKPLLAVSSLKQRVFDKLARSGIVQQLGAERFHLTRHGALQRLHDALSAPPSQSSTGEAAAADGTLMPSKSASTSLLSLFLGKGRTHISFD
jgi:SulP family sulfate permease